MGSALLAACGHVGGLAQAADAMIGYAKRVDPVCQWTARYEDGYQAFYEDCRLVYRMEG